MILALLAALQLAAPDSMPVVTLEEALGRATRFNPSYVQALGLVEEAEWGRRAARLAFFLPAISAGVDLTRYSTAFFNLGTGGLQTTSVTARLQASYDLFSATKIANLALTRAQLEGAQANELQARLAAALLTEADYYNVLKAQELARVAAERLHRAQEQLQVARARVLSGAAVASDSLKLLLEVTRDSVDQLGRDAALRVARLELGRRVGLAGPADAKPLDPVPAPLLTLTLTEAVQSALEQGPEYRVARANEQAASATLRGRRGGYLPVLSLSASHQRFDDHFFPSARGVSALTLSLNLPIWNNGLREIGITQARVDHAVALAVRDDLLRAAQRDVTEAYDAYNTARIATDLDQIALAAAGENNRVQEARYRSGATTILDLVDAQFDLAQAEADLVQSRYVARLALAALEAMLGRRLFPVP